MSLTKIDEETMLESFSSTDNLNRTRPLGHRAIYGAPGDDNVSFFSHSTSSTVSNLAGPGRVLGNFYSFTGKRLERTLGNIAHKAGFGPEAIYHKIRILYLEDWKRDNEKGENIYHCRFHFH